MSKQVKWRRVSDRMWQEEMGFVTIELQGGMWSVMRLESVRFTDKARVDGNGRKTEGIESFLKARLCGPIADLEQAKAIAERYIPEEWRFPRNPAPPAEVTR